MKTSAAPVAETADTRELILAAAGRIFGRQGFRATTVRQITQDAGVNIAAVNYHFRDKQELYTRVLLQAHQAGARMAKVQFTGTPLEQLRTFLGAFLGYLLDPGRPEWHGQLIAREMLRPTAALDRLVIESIHPVKERLSGIMREILGPGVPEEKMRLACFSIMGQCLYYIHCREMIVRVFPAERHIHRNVDTLADHIFQFSVPGLQALRREHAGQSEARPRRKGTS